MTDAIVVGGGPNGLAAAIEIARNGHSVTVYEANDTIGGGCRSAELTLPGFVHDTCSAIHPLGAGSRFFAELGLERHGLEWIHPAVPLAHPLDDGTAAVLARSVDETARGLGTDADAYRRIFAPLARRWSDLLEDAQRPVAHVPRHPLLFARFGLTGMRSAKALARRFETEHARALVAGLAAHSFLPLDAPFTGTFALMLGGSAHAVGWPLPRGGSQRIADALAATLRERGGEIVTGRRVQRLAELGDARAILFDTDPAQLARIAADRLPAGYRRALARYRRGPGVFKIDYALDGPIPWRAAECARAGTVHVGGTFEEVAASEAQVARGQPPERPFLLVAQQSLFDPTRAPAGKHTAWVYCHVPYGSTFDMTERIESQLERFALGFRDRVLARAILTPALIEKENANNAGGDISNGSHAGLQLIARPVLRFDPYATPVRELYLCSAATPPGAGVHGMCGYNAARSALRRSLS